MQEYEDNLTRRIEDGSYYKEGREWYNHLYIAPISQRIFFIIVTCIAVVTMLMAFTSIMNLLPISPNVPFVYNAKDIMNEIPQIHRFKEPQEEPNPALIRYYLRTYVEMRESYNARKFLMFQAFVNQYSEPQEYREYVQEIDPNNPKSPIRRYGRYQDVKVKVHHVRYNRQTIPATAEVDFSTIVIGKEQTQTTNWTATVSFDYTDLTTRNSYDESIDDYVLDFDAPTFKVLDYSKRERLRVNQGQ